MGGRTRERERERERKRERKRLVNTTGTRGAEGNARAHTPASRRSTPQSGTSMACVSTGTAVGSQ
eukprot:1521923-Rhodomonas_salina.1